MSRGINKLKDLIEGHFNETKDVVMDLIEEIIEEAKQIGLDAGYANGYDQGKKDGIIEAEKERVKPVKVNFT